MKPFWRSTMRPTPSVCLVAISMGLLLMFCNSGRPEEPQKAQPNIKELEQKRMAILEQVRDFAKALYKNARIEYTDVLSAERELFAARLGNAATQQDRIKACDEAIRDARESQELAKAHKEGARGTHIPVLQAQVFELEAQIARAKAEASE
jgi:outer membrane protein TolC